MHADDDLRHLPENCAVSWRSFHSDFALARRGAKRGCPAATEPSRHARYRRGVHTAGRPKSVTSVAWIRRIRSHGWAI